MSRLQCGARYSSRKNICNPGTSYRRSLAGAIRPVGSISGRAFPVASGSMFVKMPHFRRLSRMTVHAILTLAFAAAIPVAQNQHARQNDNDRYGVPDHGDDCVVFHEGPNEQ